MLAPHMGLPEFNCWNPQEELDAVASIWNSQFPNLEMGDGEGGVSRHSQVSQCGVGCPVEHTAGERLPQRRGSQEVTLQTVLCPHMHTEAHTQISITCS